MAKDEDFYEEEKHGGFFRKLFFVIILIICMIVVYSKYIATTGLILKEYDVDKINVVQSYKGFKIAHFTDFYYGRTTHIEELKNLVEKINMTKPDIIVFSGDFIDKDTKLKDDEVTKITEELNKLDSTYGKYYVTGDEDIKCESYSAMFDNSGFISLDNSYDIIYNKNNDPILISGLSYKGNSTYLDELMQSISVSFKIFVMHMPDEYEKIKDYNFDLVLAGHSLNGQIRIPFYGAIITPKGAKEYYDPHYKINTTDLYISGGIGTIKYDYRLFNRPSFNIYKLKNSSI